MKKSLSSLVFVCSLALSCAAFAFGANHTFGPTPVCTSGKLNIEIYVKDIDSCPADMAHAEYCIYDEALGATGDKGEKCENIEDSFIRNTNESYSFNAKPSHVMLTHVVGSQINGEIKNQTLYFVYDHGATSDNCSEVFGSDVKCVINQSGDSRHPLYTLTISKK